MDRVPVPETAKGPPATAVSAPVFGSIAYAETVPSE